MKFLDLVEKQWDDYSDRHRNRNGLLIKLVAVALFWFVGFQLIGGLLLMLLGVPGAFGMLFWALVLGGISLGAQQAARSMERGPQERAKDPAELVQRILADQFINFPRFVLSGRWLKNLQGA
jgi:hypothetical protein